MSTEILTPVFGPSAQRDLTLCRLLAPQTHHHVNANDFVACRWHWDFTDRNVSQRDVHQLVARTTRTRVALGNILFAKGNRHISAEMLFEEANQAKVSVSLATVYNTLHQFTEAGLLRQVAIDSSKSYFDTNNTEHHHYYLEDSGGHFGGAEIGRGFGRGFAGSHFAGRHGNFGRERGFRTRGFDHRRFGRGFGVVPGWGYGLYDYGCSYGYPNYYGYSCDTPPAY